VSHVTGTESEVMVNVETAMDGVTLSSGYELQIETTRCGISGRTATQCNQFFHALQDTVPRKGQLASLFQGVEMNIVLNLVFA